MKQMSIAAAVLLAAPVFAETPEALVARGAYLARIMDCAGCHMPRGPDGAPDPAGGLSGGTIGFQMPGVGIFWPPNLTPDPTGLGGWSEAEIIAALTTGLRPDGRVLAPIMPWPSYAAMSEADQKALAAFLRAMPPVARQTPQIVASAAEAQAPFYAVTMP